MQQVRKRRQSDISITGQARPEDIAYLTTILAQNRVDWEHIWPNPHETLADLARECRKGESVLAEEDKKIVRVVDVVVPVLTAPSGHVLVKLEQSFKGGLSDEEKYLLPGKKRLAWEHRNVAALRALDQVGIKSKHVKFTLDRTMLIQKKVSTTCPGIETVYRRHVLHLEFEDAYTSDEYFSRDGWPKGEPLSDQTAQRGSLFDQKEEKRSTWTWITGEAFNDSELLQGDAELAARYAAVVPARTHDQLGQADLRKKTEAVRH